MTRSHEYPWILVLVAALGLAACGGGSAGPIAGGGISGTGKPGVKFGDVQTATGITVGGTTFQTTTAAVTIGGAPATVGDIRDGHVALVEGLIDGASGTAGRITIEDVVAGTLSAKPSPSTLTVQGQVVEVDERTLYGSGISPASPDGLLIDDLLRVWGFVKASGRVLATRIERTGSLAERRVVGEAASVNTALHTFSIGGQAIDYSAADVSKLTGGHPVDGQVVQVRGPSQLGAGGVLSATRVEAVPLDDAEDNDDTEIRGFVTALLSATSFQVGGVTVQTSATTRFEGGVAADLMLGTAVEVQGGFQSGAVLAQVVQFGAAVLLESDVDAVGGNLLTLVGLPGVVVMVSDLTEFEEEISSLGDLHPGDHVRVRGRHLGGGDVAAVEIEKRSASTRIEIQGPVDAAPAPSDPHLSILGVSIDTTGLPDGAFESPEGGAFGRATFFAALMPGDIVKVSGTLSGGSAAWNGVDLEGTPIGNPHEEDDD